MASVTRPLTTLLLSAGVCLALSACGDSSTNSTTGGGSESEGASTSTTTAGGTTQGPSGPSSATDPTTGDSAGLTTTESPDSNTDAMTSTPMTTELPEPDPICGNGVLEVGEECDDGNADNDDTCLDTCVEASCGDGYVGPGEGCDDGNDVDDDECSNECVPGECGDGVVQQGELCDDGNDVETDACLSTCAEASCGDGYVWEGVETCDDGNADDDDACNNQCVFGCIADSKQCVDNENFETCNDMGEWIATPCDPGTSCSGGECYSLCELAAQNNASVGCLYYAIDADNHNSYDAQQYAVVVSNVDDSETANVNVYRWTNNQWTVFQSQQVAPGTLYQFNLPGQHINQTGVNTRGAYKVESDVPIIAYQFQPINGQTSFTSDASLLLPVSALDEYYYIVGWGQNSFLRPEIQIVATEDNTNVTLTPATNTTAGGGLPALTANQPYDLPALNEGDYAQFEGVGGFNGSYIVSDKPISVFSSHICANVPSVNQACCCDHIEEQTFGLQTWGLEYVASRFAVRNNNNPEPSYWHVFAAEDATTITISANEAVTGLGNQNLMLNAGEFVELAVDGSVQHPGDFWVSADKPISVMQYMSSQNAGNAGTGDPAMSQAVPVEQYRPNYVVLVPPNWINDYLVVTKPADANVTLDGNMIAENQFTAVGPQNDPTDWEVARISVSDGVHNLSGDADFSVTVVGFDSYDSYAYPGGLNQQVINPQ